MNTYAHIYTQLYINIHTCTKKTNIHTSIFTHKYSHININIYVYIYIHIKYTNSYVLLYHKAYGIHIDHH